MRAQRKTREEQYQLILECRNSGLSDYNWCTEHDINPGTFYNWVKRLRKTGVYDIPAPAGIATYAPTPKQDIVKVELMDDVEESVVQLHKSVPPAAPGLIDPQSFQASLELVIEGSSLKISNQVDPELLAQVIFLIRKQ